MDMPTLFSNAGYWTASWQKHWRYKQQSVIVKEKKTVENTFVSDT